MPARSGFPFGSADLHLSVLYVPWHEMVIAGGKKKKRRSHNNAPRMARFSVVQVQVQQDAATLILSSLCTLSPLCTQLYSKCQKSFRDSTSTQIKIATSLRPRSQGKLVQVLPSFPFQSQLLIDALPNRYYLHRSHFRRHLILHLTALQASGMLFNDLVSRSITGRGWLLLSLCHQQLVTPILTG